MNVASVIVLLLVVLAVAAAILGIRRRRKEGKCISCDGCALKDCCDSVKKNA